MHDGNENNIKPVELDSGMSVNVNLEHILLSLSACGYGTAISSLCWGFERLYQTSKNCVFNWYTFFGVLKCRMWMYACDDFITFFSKFSHIIKENVCLKYYMS